MSRRRTLSVAAAGLATATVLAGCGAADAPEEAGARTASTQVEVVGAPAPEADLDAGAVPSTWGGFAAVDPGWDQRPLESDGRWLGFELSDEGPLVFTAVDSTGQGLWRTERPPACSGFALSRAGDRTVAVLTDTADGGLGTTASAYDLATGEPVWGPVDVPGPHQGPGLVFAEPAAAMGETGPRVALDPATGDVAVRAEEGRDVLGEHDGVVLVAGGGFLRAVDAGSGEESWVVPVADLRLPDGDLAELPDAPVPAGTALVGAVDGGLSTGTLVDLASGEALATGVARAAQDAAVGTLVTLGDGVLRGFGDGEELWTQPVEDETRLAAVGGALVYLREGDAVRVLNVVTGDAAVAYEDTADHYLVPSHVAATGAAVVRTDDYLLLTTAEA